MRLDNIAEIGYNIIRIQLSKKEGTIYDDSSVGSHPAEL